MSRMIEKLTCRELFRHCTRPGEKLSGSPARNGVQRRGERARFLRCVCLRCGVVVTLASSPRTRCGVSGVVGPSFGHKFCKREISAWATARQPQCHSQRPGMISAPPAAVAKQTASGSMLRILCLHGYVQNSNVFRKRIGGLRKAVKNIAEFDFVDAPHSAAGAFGQTAKDADGGSAEDGPPLGWWNSGENQDAGPDKEWIRPSISKRALGAQESLEVIRQAIKANGPYDGLLGFSQGATMAAMLMATEPAAARFAVLAGGFIPFDEAMAEMMTAGAPIPAEALIVSGETDQLVPPERSRQLQALFGKYTEFYSHPGGHGIPSSADWRNALKAFLVRQQEMKQKEAADG